MIHLVLGPSSVGKSTYIEQRLSHGDWRGLPIYMAYELDRGVEDPRLDVDCVVHYSLFRPFRNRVEQINNQLVDDPALGVLLARAGQIQAHLLVSPHAELARRILIRDSARVEPRLKADPKVYRNDMVFELLCALDLSSLYRRWIALLRDHLVPLSFIHAVAGEFQDLASEEDVLTIVADRRPVSYSLVEIDRIMRTFHFEYQRIAITPERMTPGQDRSPSLQFLDPDLSGRTLLDIGCGYGFFCHEAVRRGATRVVGTELKPHRFLGCLVLNEILGHGIRFLRQDIFDHPLDETFDVVLLLNVIHHLKEPVRGLRMAARYCREKLIIEFPTLADPKFRASMPAKQLAPAEQMPDWMDPQLPLIGVSLLTGQDQTFLFSPTAIFRILMEHERLFSRIEFMPSPMAAERCVAICYK